jgi:hypothetical protein
MADELGFPVGEPLVVSRGGVPAAVMSATREEEDRIAGVLRQEGYQVAPAAATTIGDDGLIHAGEECTEEKPRPCEVLTVAGRVQELAQEAGGSDEAIASLLAQEEFTEEEARQAVMDTIAAMPAGEAREEAELWYDAGWPAGDQGG